MAARALDPDGREVVFDAGTYLHLALGARRPLLDQIDAIMATIEVPDHRSLDPLAGRERFYRQNALEPRRWLRVVVDFNQVPGWVVTALVQTRDPRQEQQ